jgi:hypothetical protein
LARREAQRRAGHGANETRNRGRIDPTPESERVFVPVECYERWKGFTAACCPLYRATERDQCETDDRESALRWHLQPGGCMQHDTAALKEALEKAQAIGNNPPC